MNFPRADKVNKSYHLKNVKNFAEARIRLHRQEDIEIGFGEHLVDMNRPLSIRECEVLHLAAMGMTNPQIAEILSISNNTVKSHFDHIFNKLGLPNRTLAVLWAAHHGLV